MGVLQDVLDLVKDIKNNEYLDVDASDRINLKFGRNSIAKKAGHAILQFPVLTSDVISVQDLTMVNKALEREFATLVRVAMGLDDIITDPNMDKVDYIRQFHQNTGTKGTLHIDRGLFKEDLEQQNLRALRPFSEDLRLDILNDKTTSNNRNHYVLGGSKRSKSMLSESRQRRNGLPAMSGGETDYPSFVAGEKMRKDSQYTNALVPNDVKKANELVPTTLDISIFYANKQGQAVQSNVFLGVKTITHLVPSEEMIFNVAKAVEEKRGFFRTIQWTTGEIAFFKDYLFMIDRIKREATGRRTDSHWWRSLKRRALEDKIKRFSFSKKELLPNATILITMDEVEYIMNNYNIDLIQDMSAVQNLMKTFFLLGFVIVDPAAELAYFFFDGQTTYQTYSYNSLERENTSTNEVKSIVSLMNKI